jgi:hypothetical protein
LQLVTVSPAPVKLIVYDHPTTTGNKDRGDHTRRDAA